ncbi:hypothetical protein P153DRAFT_380202 [Dothidotthia symphoricarpi CBS 119687]|uniref:RapZ C-terminal domain-containing protein n=1 Tax=Dothidotthia symphoricarpi CBS 119687 TaxID=1392245 RepID=A0A6A6AV24_9PLEO|nr:uncharacterized protein P153DRAFT_380202 [Dothidotthia symphoricarpi CBS 119687]KAF2134391.1 hypothetical protein P153DRAFT_380202 [Dothidotthia symphoricarpi CBS 119687]
MRVGGPPDTRVQFYSNRIANPRTYHFLLARIPRTINPISKFYIQHPGSREMDSRHVHFDLIPRGRTQYTRHDEEYTYQSSREGVCEDTPSHLLTRHSHSRVSPLLLPVSDSHSSQPTIYIVTFSNVQTPTLQALNHLLTDHLPHRDPPIPHLYTIDASNMTPPPSQICAAYSGLSPVVQEYVMQDARAREAVRRAVKELLAFGERKRGGRGRNEVALSVCCVAGTHRSVSIAERIAREVNTEVRRLGGGDGVRVVARHVHRVRGKRDPF